MCFDLDSAPPIPPISGAAVSHDDLVLEARDGNRFAAFVATPEEPARVGVVILPDVRGLYRFYEELALRFAERGYAGDRVRLLRADGRGREARRRLRVHAARRSRRRRTASRPTSARASRTFAQRAARRSSRSASASAAATRGSPPRRGHGLAGAIGFYGRPGTGRRRLTGADAARRGDGSADPRAPGRRRPGHPGRRTRRRSTRRSPQPASSTRS